MVLLKCCSAYANMTFISVDGYWQDWAEWQTCNTTCGGGYQVRVRQCELPKFSGDDCEGESQDWQSCNTHHCPGEQNDFGTSFE